MTLLADAAVMEGPIGLMRVSYDPEGRVVETSHFTLNDSLADGARVAVGAVAIDTRVSIGGAEFFKFGVGLGCAGVDPCDITQFLMVAGDARGFFREEYGAVESIITRTDGIASWSTQDDFHGAVATVSARGERVTISSGATEAAEVTHQLVGFFNATGETQGPAGVEGCPCVFTEGAVGSYSFRLPGLRSTEDVSLLWADVTLPS